LLVKIVKNACKETRKSLTQKKAKVHTLAVVLIPQQKPQKCCLMRSSYLPNATNKHRYGNRGLLVLSVIGGTARRDGLKQPFFL
jgi:hypothetical protein